MMASSFFRESIDADRFERAEVREGDRLIRPAKGDRAAETARSEPRHLAITIEAYALE
jgi:hypothetical protein